jgi:hypothetical protein
MTSVENFYTVVLWHLQEDVQWEDAKKLRTKNSAAVSSFLIVVMPVHVRVNADCHVK